MNEIGFPTQEGGIVQAPRAGYPPEDDPRQALFTRYLNIANRSKWLVLGAIFAMLTLGLLITLLTTRLYTAETRLEINRVGARIVNVEGVQPETSAVDMEFYQTQYGILKSRAVAERVARSLRLADNPEFFAIFGLQDRVEGLVAGRSASAQGRDERFLLAVDILLRNVEITPVRMSKLVDIGWTSPDPQLSARVANEWAQSFIQHNLERRYEATAQARSFLEQRLAQLRQRLEESERQLVGYASQQAIINIPVTTTGPNGAVSQERSLTGDTLAALNTELANAVAERMRNQSRMQGARSGATTEALTNPVIAALRERRAETAAEYARLMTQFEPGYPPAMALAAQLRQLDQSISGEETRVQSSLQNAYRDSVQREHFLTAGVDNLKQQFLDQRRRSIQYNIFQREVDTNRELYNGLLQRYKEIGIAGGVGENNVLVVDTAQAPDRPSHPKLLLNLLLSLLVGLGLGGGLALLRELIDDSVNDPTEVETRLGLPLLGVLPRTVSAEPLLDLNDPKSNLMEASLSILTNLSFSTDHGIPRSLTVTSTKPGEGKSTTVQTIAYILARQGLRTVLVDADMRSPSLHHNVNLPNTKGLSNFLAGGEPLSQLVQKPENEPFFVILAGPQPPNAAELLRGDGVQRLIRELSQSFDHIIIDSPPVMGLADAPLIGSWTEGTIFVVEAHSSRARIIRQAMGRLRQSRAKLLGVVFAKFESRRGSYGYGHQYGYGYGYGYGRDEQNQT
jgi:capsular exopolysaccharide synthesis family protein